MLGSLSIPKLRQLFEAIVRIAGDESNSEWFEFALSRLQANNKELTVDKRLERFFFDVLEALGYDSGILFDTWRCVRVKQIVETLSDDIDKESLPAGLNKLNSYMDYPVPFKEIRSDEEIWEWFHSTWDIGCTSDFEIEILENTKGLSVVQEWVAELPMMQQTVLLTCVRGPDGMPKYSPPKFIARWFRRCILLSAIDGIVLTDPAVDGGGSFTGPSVAKDGDWKQAMQQRIDDFVREEDAIPAHYMAHIRHGAEILGYKHPEPEIREWWHQLYRRLVNLLHLHPETEAELDERLGDTLEGWIKRGDSATER
jgi:hypothetical protein